jgi:excisionase family DNA binding protein
MKVEAGDEVLTLKEAAERLNLSAGTLRLQVRAGKMAATLAGKTYLVMASEVERYRRDHLGKHGFAAESHPFHGQRPPRKGEPGEH